MGRNLFQVRAGRLENDLYGKAMSGEQDEYDASSTLITVGAQYRFQADSPVTGTATGR